MKDSDRIAITAVVDPGDEVILPSPTYSTHIQQAIIATGIPILVPTIETDEAYEYFTYDGHKHFSIASIPEMRKNVISCFTFTKTYAMTGWRVGYLHADDEKIPQITKAHITFAICAPVVSQYAALSAMTGSQDCVSQFREHYLSTRNLMCERLDSLDSVFEYKKPDGSYLMFLFQIIANYNGQTICIHKCRHERGWKNINGRTSTDKNKW